MSGITVRGLTKTLNTLAQLEEHARDVRPVGDRLKAVYLQSNARRFNESPWQPLADVTVERKRQQGLSTKPLVAKGALKRSLTARSARGQIDKRHPESVAFGSKLFYAAWQQGTVFQPKREIIELSWIERQMIKRIVERWVAKGDKT